ERPRALSPRTMRHSRAGELGRDRLDAWVLKSNSGLGERRYVNGHIPLLIGAQADDQSCGGRFRTARTLGSLKVVRAGWARPGAAGGAVNRRAVDVRGLSRSSAARDLLGCRPEIQVGRFRAGADGPLSHRTC